MLFPLDGWEYWGTVTSGVREPVGNRDQSKITPLTPSPFYSKKAELFLRTAPCNSVFPEKSYFFFPRIGVDSRQIIRWLVRYNLRSFQQGLCPRVTLLTSSYRAQNATSAWICWALRKSFPSERQWCPEVVYPKQKLDFCQGEDLEAGIIGHVWTPSGKNRVLARRGEMTTWVNCQ